MRSVSGSKKLKHTDKGASSMTVGDDVYVGDRRRSSSTSSSSSSGSGSEETTITIRTSRRGATVHVPKNDLAGKDYIFPKVH